VVQPLPPDSGIHLLSLPTSTLIPAHISAVADTDYATTLGREGTQVRTVEHFFSALHAYGVTNLLIKVHGEIPVLDGSALGFCHTLEQIGIVDQEAPRREVVIDRRYEVTSGGEKRLAIEPHDGFAISYLLRYPPPIGEQLYEFELADRERYKAEIAPARTFGFMRDLKMMNELGLGSGGRLDNFILVGEDDVLNTDLRFPDEFVRHKILDIIGDLYLLGYPIRGKVTANNEGPRYCVACHLNQAQLANFNANNQYTDFFNNMANNNFAGLDFNLLQQHIGQNTGNQLNSPYFVHMAAGLGTGLFLFDETGCPVNPLDNNANRHYCPNGAPAANFNANTVNNVAVYNLDRIVEATGISNASNNHPMKNPGAGGNYRGGSLNQNMSGPLGGAYLQKLANPNLGLILDSWLDANGAPQGGAANHLR